MKRNRLIFLIAAVLLILAGAQIIADNNTEKQHLHATAETLKHTGYAIFIDIEEKTLYLLEDDKCIKRYTIASGMSGLPSPIGAWKIINKGEWDEGFGGRWLGLDVPWGTYGIHGTQDEDSIGSSASHGCIRMFNRDVVELYDIVPAGTPVVIENGIFGPFGRGFDEINPGDRGADVREIQLKLKALGYFKGWPSGIYEDDLKIAVHKFQKDKGIEVENVITKEAWLAMGFREFD